MLHNGCLVFLGYFQPQLSQLSWFPAEGENVPATWLVPAIVVSLIAVAMITAVKPSEKVVSSVA